MTTLTFDVRLRDMTGNTSPWVSLAIPEQDEQNLRPQAYCQFHATWDYMANGDTYNQSFTNVLAGIKDMGFEGVRIDVSWSQSQSSTAPPSMATSFHTRLARMAKKINESGLSILYTLYRSPDWAHPGVSGPTNYPDAAHLNAWGQWCGWWASNFPAVGYEMWNEPDLTAFSGKPTDDALSYAAVLAAGYDGIKAVRPSALVVSGGPSNAKWKFIEQTVQAKPGKLDVVGVHTYQGNWSYPPSSYNYSGVSRDPENRWTQYRSAGGMGGAAWTGSAYVRDDSSLNSVKAVLTRNSLALKPVWVTEHGVSDSTQSADAARSVGMSGVGATWATIGQKAGSYRVEQFDWLRQNLPATRMVVQYCAHRPDVGQPGGGTTSNTAMRLLTLAGAMTAQAQPLADYLWANRATRSLT